MTASCGVRADLSPVEMATTESLLGYYIYISNNNTLYQNILESDSLLGSIPGPNPCTLHLMAIAQHFPGFVYLIPSCRMLIHSLSPDSQAPRGSSVLYSEAPHLGNPSANKA